MVDYMKGVVKLGLDSICSIPKKYLFVFIAGVAFLAGRLFIVRTAAWFMDETPFSIFLVGLRSLTVIEAIASVGMGIAIPKYLAQHKEKQIADSYFIASLIISSFSLLIVLITLNTFCIFFSRIFFGNQENTDMMFSLSILLVGTIVSGQIYSYFRGHLRFYSAKLLQLLQFALIPIFCIILFAQNPRAVWINTGLGMIITTIPIIYCLRLEVNVSLIKVHFWIMLKYGIQRVFANILYMCFLSLPVFLITWSRGIIAAADIAVAVTVMNMIVYLFAIVDTVLLPKVSNHISTNKTRNLYQMLSKVLIFSLIILIPTIALAELWAPYILRILVGNKLSNEGIIATRLLLLAALPLSIFMAFRGVVDAKYSKALNSLYLLMSFCVFSLSAGLVFKYSGSWFYLLLTFVGSSYFLGGLILRELLIVIRDSRASFILQKSQL